MHGRRDDRRRGGGGGGLLLLQGRGMAVGGPRTATLRAASAGAGGQRLHLGLRLALVVPHSGEGGVDGLEVARALRPQRGRLRGDLQLEAAQHLGADLARR